VTFHRSTLPAMLVICLSFSGSATTCIALKKFKVRQVCGQVQTVLGDVITDATVHVIKKGNPDTTARVESDNSGNFTFGRLDEGEYTIQVDVRGFHSASQEVEIRQPRRQTQECGHPLIARMQVADAL
jgi:Carboxypeptidase regulatory-like domain